MGWVFERPSLTALEVAWRWLFGVPFLVVCWIEAQQILAALPPESAGLTTLDPQNPWVAAVQLSNAWALYQPHVVAVLRWLLPAGRAGLGGRLRAGPQPGSQAHGSRALRFRPVGDDRLAGRMAGALCRHLLGLVPLHRNGSRPRTSPPTASRTWWATRSGRSSSRWGSSRPGRWSVGRSRLRRC